MDNDGGQWWNMFIDNKDGNIATGVPVVDNTHKLAPVEPAVSSSSARSSLLFPESGRASSSSSEIEEEPDDVDTDNASTTTDTSSIAARRRNSKKRLGGSRGGNMTALSGATLLLEGETDGEDAEPAVADAPGSLGKKPSTAISVWRFTSEQRQYYIREFSKLQPKLTRLIPGLLAKQYFLRSELHNQILAQIWAMSDLDADGALNIAEFCCAMHLVVAVRNGVDLPQILPAELLQSAMQIADEVAGEASIKSPAKNTPSDANDSFRAAPSNNEADTPLRTVAGPSEPWPNIGSEVVHQHNLTFPSNTPSRASSMASNLASFDDRPPSSAIYPFAVRPAPALPTQIPPPPPPRRAQKDSTQPAVPSSPPAPPTSVAPNAEVNVTSLLTSHAVSSSVSSLQPLLPVTDSASITSATSDSSQLQLLVPPLEQLRSQNQKLAIRYRELLAELERIRMERTTLQTRLKQYRNSNHHRGSFDQPTVPVSSAIGSK